MRRLLFRGLIMGLFLCLGIFLYFFSLSLKYDLSRVGDMPQRAVITDRDGKPYNRIYGENRLAVEYEKVSKYFVDALLSREDSRFYWHLGVDPLGIARAIVRNIQAGHLREGASTITQQLARNTYPLGGKTLHRKMLEAVVALRIEARYSKKEILQHYMNRIYFGSGLYGVEAASLGYFGKSSESLSLSEAALLAGLIRAPNTFSPLRNLEGALGERDDVLRRMQITGRITTQQMEEAMREEVKLADGYWLPTQNYALDYIRRELQLMLDQKQRKQGGMIIKTSLDADLQEAARAALDQHLTKMEQINGWRHPKRAAFQGDPDDPDSQTPYLQGAVVIIDNRTGGIRAFVGGRDYYESKFNRALMARRQVGSIFKPFVYATAFQHGLLPHSKLSDDRLRPGEIHSTPTNWSPANSDGEYHGVKSADYGLYKSRNTMTVRAGEIASLPHVLRVADRAGLSREQAIPPYPSIYLGAFEANLRDITTAYTMFPNRGYRPKEHIIEEIIDGEEVLSGRPPRTCGSLSLTPAG
jgi:penicillin-binding protein 1A